MDERPTTALDPESLADEATGTFAAVFREAVQRRGIGLERLRERLRQRGTPVSLATLSYWQSGRSQPERPDSMRALVQLEEVLQVPPGHLTSRLTPPRPRGRSKITAVDRASLLPRAAIVHAALDELGFADGEELMRMVMHDILTIDEDSRETTQQVRLVHRGERDGAARWPLVHVMDELETPAPLIIAGRGCHVGREVRDDAHGLVVAEMVLDRPLRRGDTSMTEHTLVNVPTREASFHFERSTPKRVRDVAIDIDFHELAMPSVCEAYLVVDDVETVHEVELEATRTAHLYVPDFGPGVVGIRWWW